MKISALIKTAFSYDFVKEFQKHKKMKNDLSWLKEDPSYDDAFGTVTLDYQYILEGVVTLESKIDINTFLNDEHFMKNFKVPSDKDEAKKVIAKIFEKLDKDLVGLLEFPNWDKFVDQPENEPDFSDTDKDGPLKHWKPDPRRNYDVKSEKLKLVFNKMDARFFGDTLEIFYEWQYE